jgi:hypothetical protein
MRPNISNHAVTLLGAAPVGRGFGTAEDLRFELVDASEYRHPPLLDRLDVQTEIDAQLRIGLA